MGVQNISTMMKLLFLFALALACSQAALRLSGEDLVKLQPQGSCIFNPYRSHLHHYINYDLNLMLAEIPATVAAAAFDDIWPESDEQFNLDGNYYYYGPSKKDQEEKGPIPDGYVEGTTSPIVEQDHDGRTVTFLASNSDGSYDATVCCCEDWESVLCPNYYSVSTIPRGDYSYGGPSEALSEECDKKKQAYLKAMKKHHSRGFGISVFDPFQYQNHDTLCACTENFSRAVDFAFEESSRRGASWDFDSAGYEYSYKKGAAETEA